MWISLLYILGSVYVFADDYYGKEITFEKPEIYNGICNSRALLGGWTNSITPGSCNLFYQCDENGVSHVQRCAAGTFYNGKECRHADKVHCLNDPCQYEPEGYSYADGQSCYGYFVCIHGRSKYLTCPNAFYYNSYKKSCHPDPTCFKDNLRHPCSFGTTYPTPGNPSNFYLYDGRSTMTLMKCPRGLWYRPEICSCDWIIPGKIFSHGCSPLFHFSYDGNFLERNNRVQQVPNNKVAIYRKSALFNRGGKIIIWAMSNVDLSSDFSLCFEFFVKTHNGEVALISNDLNGYGATYKITVTPALGIVKAYIMQKDGRLIQMTVVGVNPNRSNFLRLARSDEKLTLRVNNMPAAVVKCAYEFPKYITEKPINNTIVMGAAGIAHSSGASFSFGLLQEVKFFRCVPKGFTDDYEDFVKSRPRHHDDSSIELN